MAAKETVKIQQQLKVSHCFDPKDSRYDTAHID